MVLTQTDLPNLLHKGKVRDTYDLGDGLMLMVATDRISAFDVVLPNGIPSKGLVLSRLSAFWFGQTSHLVPNHLIALADDTARLGGLATNPRIAGLRQDIARRAMVVRRAHRIDIECIVRGYLAGSAWAEYQKSGTICGQPAPADLREGDRLPQPLFTPTTKAEVGHDENMTPQQVETMVGADTARLLEERSIAIYQYAHDYAREQGIVIADTKMEFGWLDAKLILIDELLTPDSSRFWDLAHYQPGRSQPNFDKQFVRDWLTASGWNMEPPAPRLPDDVVQKTSERYLEAYRRLTG